jgi:hypothetical protein
MDLIYIVPMSLPLDVIRKCQPTIMDPTRYSIQYTFSDEDVVEQHYDFTLYRVPYSLDTYWTHFKFAPYGTQSSLLFEMLLISHRGESHTIMESMKRNPDEWYDTTWPLPSLPITNHSGLYLKVIYPSQPGESYVPPSFTLLGFLHLFPIVSTYLLCSEHGSYIFLREKEKSTILCGDYESEDATLLYPFSHY